jgi:multisubunit Na+/H+ antiporter MnhC subunit
MVLGAALGAVVLTLALRIQRVRRRVDPEMLSTNS